MGYYANGSGSVTFNRVLDEKEISILENAFENAWFEYDFSMNTASLSQGSSFDMWSNDKYHEDEVLDLLEAMKDIAPIVNGYIEYTGEDGSNWRFIFKDGKWLEQNGTVVYDDSGSEEDGFERRTIVVKPSAFSPEFEMIIKIPNERDAEEYIDELLDGILSDEFKYNIEWDFADGLS